VTNLSTYQSGQDSTKNSYTIFWSATGEGSKDDCSQLSPDEWCTSP